MSDLSWEDVVTALGPVNEDVVVEIMETGIDPVEFAEARVWQAQNKALMEDGNMPRHPAGRVGHMLDILDRVDAERDTYADATLAPA